MRNSENHNTKALLKFAIKRDLTRSVIWLMGIGGMILLFTLMFENLLTTYEDIATMTVAQSTSPATRIFMAPASGVSLGGFMMLRVSTTIITFFGLFSFLTVIRHTRQSEDLGRLELLGSTAIGRYSTATSALLLTGILNLVLSAMTFGIFLIVADLPWDGALLASLSFGLFGILFAVIGTITAQLSQTSRGASGLAGIVLAVSFLISGLGNALGEFYLDTFTVESHFMTWFSPYGWYQQMHVFHDNSGTRLLLYVGAILLLLPLPYLLLQRRDLGAGILPAKKGRTEASALLSSPLGLAWRLHRKLMIVWILVALFLGTLFGSISEDFSESLSALEQAGAVFSEEQMLLSLISILGSLMVIYVVQSLLILSGEEKNGGLEEVLSSPVSRRTWFGGHVLMILLGSLLILLAIGLTTGITAANQDLFTVGMLLEATMLLLPAFIAVAGISLFAYSVSHHFFPAVPWAVLIASLGFGPFFGSAMDLPEFLRNLSPFTHVPYQFAEMEGIGYWIFAVVGLVTLILATLRIRHRPLDLP
ncbi:ABC-2 type transport system permease protein [Natranaerovirga hydrolytica]|uniref:ABC-2 type transport system permease protein n=1 Tax=Natranaerovirga hydrolytica TaxID=680378 RepID=A0A4R1MJD0_9FIRM|nr:hypothetical protein [Natranaerovirga hydrolytica]TCK92587.1 ABC-2 type transport system permease protein [Natranaerovirga hydrolytica]